jgi:hypothetical protein
MLEKVNLLNEQQYLLSQVSLFDACLIIRLHHVLILFLINDNPSSPTLVRFCSDLNIIIISSIMATFHGLCGVLPR